MQFLANALLDGENIHEIDSIRSHADWVDEWRERYEITTENVMTILQKEIADCFVQVLECAGVYKQTEEGMTALKRFLEVCK